MRQQYVASIDGFGDRDDIALANDRQEGQLQENKAIKNWRSTPWSRSGETATRLSELNTLGI